MGTGTGKFVMNGFVRISIGITCNHMRELVSGPCELQRFVMSFVFEF